MGLLTVLLGTCSRFGRETTIPGWSQAARSKSWLRAAYWIAILVFGLAITVYGLINVST